MLFNSHIFIFAFLPFVLLGYWALKHCNKPTLLKSFLLAASFVFYGYFKLEYTIILAMSILVNFAVANAMRAAAKSADRKAWLTFGLVANIATLGWFKYAGFVLFNLQLLTDSTVALPQILLPLGISFFTFQQIAFLVDSYRGSIIRASFLDYALFVTYFPQLIAGPIVTFTDIKEQYSTICDKPTDMDAIARGAALFAIGLFKKEILADQMAYWVNAGFDHSLALTFFEAWGTSLAYTFQIYFDFSGYIDMAIGIGMMMNITLPANFDSPYQSTSIQDFWRRWHMTLGRFLRDYLYIPLGGSQKGTVRTCINLVTVFLLAGLWHGAGWLFILWGGLHGVALVVHRLWHKTHIAMPRYLACILTFLFVHTAWIFFRATTWYDAIKILRGMVGHSTFILQDDLLAIGGKPYLFIVFLVACSVTAFCMRNSRQLVEEMRFTTLSVCAVSVMLLVSFLGLYDCSTFLYFNF